MQQSFNFSNSIDIYDIRNFVIHDGNREIFEFITSSYFINNNIYLLTGSIKSGKTYISNIWNKLKGAKFLDKIDSSKIEPEKKYILEDLEKLNFIEENFLHFLNTVVEKNSILLITSNKYVEDFDFSIPDLSSRFLNIVNFALRELNEESKQQIILKLLADKQMNIDLDMLNYISRKISGNYEVIFDFVNKMETFLQSNKIKKMTISNIKEILNTCNY